MLKSALLSCLAVLAVRLTAALAPGGTTGMADGCNRKLVFKWDFGINGILELSHIG